MSAFKEDLLGEDPVISSQKFTCLSFLSPEEILKQKQLFYFEKFLNTWDFTKSMGKFTEFMKFICYKYKVDETTLMSDFTLFVKEENETLKSYNCNDDYKMFIEENEEKFQNEFSIEHGFQTNVRGIKVRGSFSTQEEAEERCKYLRDIDPSHDVYVGQVGMWMPWHPNAYKTNRIEYLEQELNNLMHEKTKNEEKAKHDFDERVKTAKIDAIENNKKIARETGNKLTQNVTEKGELFSVQSSSSNVSVADIEKELFDKSEVRLKDDKDVKMKGEEK